jgi:hypothetical protein
MMDAAMIAVLSSAAVVLLLAAFSAEIFDAVWRFFE